MLTSEYYKSKLSYVTSKFSFCLLVGALGHDDDVTSNMLGEDDLDCRSLVFLPQLNSHRVCQDIAVSRERVRGENDALSATIFSRSS